MNGFIMISESTRMMKMMKRTMMMMMRTIKYCPQTSSQETQTLSYSLNFSVIVFLYILHPSTVFSISRIFFYYYLESRPLLGPGSIDQLYNYFETPCCFFQEIFFHFFDSTSYFNAKEGS